MKTKSESWRIASLCLGWLLIAVTPLVGILPGPGGIFVFAAGLILLLRNSAWVRRRYVALKRRWPRIGTMADGAMRRPSHRRRCAIAADRAGKAD